MKQAASLFTVLVLVALLLLTTSIPVASEGEDWDSPNGGHFFTQTGGGGGKGYSITNDGGIAFWTEFQRLGGVQRVGYPVSQRFGWGGYVCQAMQRVVFQWRPEIGQVYFINVFDMMHDVGKDDWLVTVRQTPRPVGGDFDANLEWKGIVAKRLSLLESNPAIKAQYYAAVGDPVTMNGLPTSPITDMGNNLTLRCQRIVIQQWKQDVPWAKAGQVTVANGGSILKEAGMLPQSVADPIIEQPRVPTPAPAVPSVPAAGTPQPPPLLTSEYRLVAQDGQYLGLITRNRYSSDSLCNEYGTYGSRYSSVSIFNRYGTYGSQYSSYSPWNQYTGKPPLIVDRDGTAVGSFSANRYARNAIDPYATIRAMGCPDQLENVD